MTLHNIIFGVLAFIFMLCFFCFDTECICCDEVRCGGGVNDIYYDGYNNNIYQMVKNIL